MELAPRQGSDTNETVVALGKALAPGLEMQLKALAEK